MTCKEFVEFLGDYLSGQLPADQAAAFSAHLALCPACVSYTRGYEDAVRRGRDAFPPTDDAVPEDVPTDLVRAILAARKKEAPHGDR